MSKYVVQEGKMVKIQESVPEVEYNIFNDKEIIFIK